MAQGYQQDYAAMGEYLRSAEMLAMVGKHGQVVKAFAESIAPFDAADLPPHYKDSFELEVFVREGAHPRACCEVRNVSSHARFVEFGGGGTPRYRVLGRALGAAK